MIDAIAPANAEATEERDGDAQNLDGPRARGGHSISSNPPDPANSDVVGVRERMLRATLKLIADGGVAAVTNRRVAAAAGVSLGSLTYHFANQAQLLRESLLLHVDEETARRRLIAQELAKEKPGVQQVAEAVEQLVAVPADIPQQIAELELHLQAARDPELREASRRCFEAHEQIASAALSALGMSDGEQHAPAVVALMTGLAVRRLAGGGQDAQGTSEALLALVRGLGPR
ncbi:MAG TPA: TetR family transcriptional regulator [Solirubrobacteraceae bacterium]|jgi:AcrR family transcriptional regulator|nr:TetR family transcriptional regulator [Solirubrobacteraceae bacterium]